MVDLEPEIIERLRDRAEQLVNKIEHAEAQRREAEERKARLCIELGDCESILRKAGAL